MRKFLTKSISGKLVQSGKGPLNNKTLALITPKTIQETLTMQIRTLKKRAILVFPRPIKVTASIKCLKKEKESESSKDNRKK